jgi:hypothetical protein
MSLQAPLIGVTSRYVSRLGKLSSFEEQLYILQSGSLEQTNIYIQHIFGINATNSKNILHSLNEYPIKQIQEILSLLPHTSIPFIYLQLHQDFHTVKKTFLDKTHYGQPFGETAFLECFKQLQSTLYFHQEFKKILLHKKSHIIKSADTFSLVSYIEEIFLTLLFTQVGILSPLMKQFILAKIDHYVCMNTITRIQKGQSQEHIMRHLLPIQGSTAITAIKSFSFGDIIGDIGDFLHIPTDQINLNTIERTLINRQVAAINKAQFSGMSGERIIQYIERLTYIIHNIKLILLQQEYHTDIEQTKSRLIDYSII